MPAQSATVGDHVFVRRFGYNHHAVVTEQNEITEYADGVIRTRPLDDFVGADPVHVYAYEREDEQKRLPTELIVHRARCFVGERAYSLRDNNCEHFAHWACTAYGTSWQLRNAAMGGAVVLGVAGLLGAPFVGFPIAAGILLSKSGDRRSKRRNLAANCAYCGTWHAWAPDGTVADAGPSDPRG